MLPSSSTGNLRSKSSMSKKRRPRGKWLSKNAMGMLCLAMISVIVFGMLWRSPSVGSAEMRRDLVRPDSAFTSRRMMPRRRQSSNTLVIYVYSGSDPEYEANLIFFLREGVQDNDGVTYIIAIQNGEGLTELSNKPRLPSNAKLVNHSNTCFDIGTVGWVLEHHVPNVRAYSYFIFLNSSVRGPFLPAYLPHTVHWTTAFTSKLSTDVKLVGSTINCGGAYSVDDPQPHVQTYAVATDQRGLQVIKEHGTVLACHKEMKETVVQSEMGMSRAIIEAGFNLDSLMLRYQGIDWRDKRAKGCNAGRNPIQESFYDGINVDPLEVLFVKVKASMRDAKWSHVLQAKKYDEWQQMASLGAADRLEKLKRNEWTALLPSKVEEASHHGAACFDHVFYTSANHNDLGFINQQKDPQAAAWQHFIQSGIQEGRPHRFTC